MDNIKSAKAYNHIYERFCCKTDEVCGLEYWDGFTEISHSELLQMLDELRGVVVVATKLAEQEADERHCHETRWRSVEEELPEDQRIVMVKTNKNSFATAYLHGKSSGFITYGDTAYLDFGKITHWKPID